MLSLDLQVCLCGVGVIYVCYTLIAVGGCELYARPCNFSGHATLCVRLQ